VTFYQKKRADPVQQTADYEFEFETTTTWNPNITCWDRYSDAWCRKYVELNFCNQTAVFCMKSCGKCVEN